MKKNGLAYNKESGFGIPENYFEEFEGLVLAKMPKTGFSEKIPAGFGTPDHYFDKFQVNPTGENTPKVVPLFAKKMIGYAASIAAIFLLMFTLGMEYSAENVSFSSINDNSITTYIENDNIDFLNLEIQNLIRDETDLSGIKFTGISKDALFNYLMDNADEVTFMNY